MATVTVQIVSIKDGTKLRVTASSIEFYSERIYNRQGNARKAAVRLVEELNMMAGTEIAALKG